MNAWQMKALIEWYKMLQASAKATEQGSDFDSQLQAWTDPRKKHQYPYDTVHDPLTPRGWQVETSENLPPGGVNYIKRRDKGMSDRENMRLLSEELERLEQSESQYRAWGKERASTQPSGMERGDIEAKRRFLEAQGRAERKGLREAPPVDLPPERTLQGQLESLEVPTVPGRELEVRPPQAPVTRHPGTLSSYSIPERGIEQPDIHVDPSGQARIVSDYYDSIVNYRKSKTGEVGKYMESFDPVEQARRIEGAEQATPARYLTPTPEQKFQTTDTQKRAAHLRKALADLKKRGARLGGAFRFRGGGGSPTGNQPLIGPVMPKLYRPPQRLQ